MGHRHIFCTSQLSDMENDGNWNHPHPDPCLHLGNGSFILPVENAAVSGVNTAACFNISLSSNEFPLSNFGLEIPNYRTANTGTPHDPYLHPSSAGSSSRAPPDYVQHGPPCYNQFTIGAMCSTVNPQMDYGRVPFKRKTPTFPAAFDSGYYSAGSSSSLHVPSDYLQPKPILGPQCWPRDPTSMGPSYGSNNLLIAGEGSQRNVRSRHSHALNSSGPHPLSNLSPQANISGGLTVAEQWSHAPVSLDPRRRTTLSSDTHRSLAGSNVTNGMEIDGVHHSTNPILSRNPTTPLPALRVPSARGTGLDRSSHGQRTTPYRAMPSYHRPMGFAATLEDGRRRPGVEAVALRHPRPLSIGRARNMYDRLSDEENARNRWVSQGVAMMDRPTFFDSRSLFDQHRAMRLDIDNMGYEELLALEERIGNVSTGLAEGKISKCLTEMIYCCEDNQEEGSCVICLDEYTDRASLGRLNCGHDFHFSCIKKWLLIKNVCPVCKASAAVEDTMEEK